MEEPCLFTHLQAYSQLAFLYGPEPPAQGMVLPLVGWAPLRQLNNEDSPP